MISGRYGVFKITVCKVIIAQVSCADTFFPNAVVTTNSQIFLRVFDRRECHADELFLIGLA